MGIEMLLLQSGTAFGVALLCAAIYRGINSHPKTSSTFVQPTQSTPEIAPNPPSTLQDIPIAETSTASQETPVVQTSIVPTMSAPLFEAPPPFEEPETAFTRPEVSSTPLPTDVNAVSNFASPVENAAPALVIARPKRTRVRKTSPDGTPRRKRMPKVKQTLPAPDPIVSPVQQDELPQP